MSRPKLVQRKAKLKQPGIANLCPGKWVRKPLHLPAACDQDTTQLPRPGRDEVRTVRIDPQIGSRAEVPFKEEISPCRGPEGLDLGRMLLGPAGSGVLVQEYPGAR
jgi:hypothetical protein